MRTPLFSSIFVVSLFLVLLYETLMLSTSLTGQSFQKILLTSLLWVAIPLTLLNLVKKFKIFRTDFPKPCRRLLYILFIWHIFNIIRGLIDLEVPISTAFGNIYNILGLLTPLAIGYALNLNNINKLFQFLMLISVVYLPIFALSLMIGGEEGPYKVLENAVVCLWPVLFIWPVGIYSIGRNIKILLLALIIFSAALLTGDRTLLLRIILLAVTVSFLVLLRIGIFNWIRKYLFVLALIPFYLFGLSVSSGESVFNQNQRTSGDDLLHDTRTFLYVEVLNDLKDSKSLWIGKGAMGTYFSDFFHSTGGDIDTRNHVEVGVLSIMLKTGIIGLFLHAGILLFAAYLGMYKSKNLFSFGIGLILLQYFDLQFIKYPMAFTLDNFLLWFFIGLPFSKELRQMSDLDILKKKLLFR